MTACPRCQKVLQIADWPFCPHGPMRSFAVRPDSIPGGQLIENLDRHPTRYYSRTEIKDAMRAKGVEYRIKHVGLPGSDKSPHTVRHV